MPPALATRHPGFDPYGLLRDELFGLPGRDRVDRCNVLARRRGLRSAAGAPISFGVNKGCPPGALGYEATILHEGRIACRREGRGALHDLHNALVWLTFPRIKATLNRLHVDCAGSAQRAGQGRGRVRDAVTLLDESGLLWLSASRLLDEQLQARDWTGLLVSNRERVRNEVLPIIVGHGLLEKLAAPYKSMTAHCLICPWPPAGGDDGGPGGGDGIELSEVDRAGNELAGIDLAGIDLARIDAAVAKRIAKESHGPVLVPLPILGLPGWDPANFDASYYDDTRVFRVQKSQ